MELDFEHVVCRIVRKATVDQHVPVSTGGGLPDEEAVLDAQHLNQLGVVEQPGQRVTNMPVGIPVILPGTRGETERETETETERERETERGAGAGGEGREFPPTPL